MIDKLINTIKEDEGSWTQFKEMFEEREIASKTVMLEEGANSKSIYFIKKGCLREWFNKDGKDITCQFFFEGQPVASIDSFMNNKPSLFTIESIEKSIIIPIDKSDFEKLLIAYPALKYEFQELRIPQKSGMKT